LSRESKPRKPRKWTKNNLDRLKCLIDSGCNRKQIAKEFSISTKRVGCVLSSKIWQDYAGEYKLNYFDALIIALDGCTRKRIAEESLLPFPGEEHISDLV
jgi:hypothetical protein